MSTLLEFLKDNSAWLVSGVGVAVASLLANLIYAILRKPHLLYAPKDYEPGEPTEVSLSALSEKLASVSSEVDVAIRTLTNDIQERQSAIEALLKRNEALSEQEQELKQRVDALKDVPIEVAKYFQDITEKQLAQYDRRNSKRDVMIFVSGVVVTTVVSIIVTLIFG